MDAAAAKLDEEQHGGDALAEGLDRGEVAGAGLVQVLAMALAFYGAGIDESHT